MDAIGEARERIGLNVAPLLALEAMAISLRVPRDEPVRQPLGIRSSA